MGEGNRASVGYVRLLRQNANFRNLWFGQLISSAGDWFNTVALLGLALQLTGNGFSAGLVLIANSLPMFLLTPLAGPIVDRFDRRKVMLIANFFGALFALSFLLIHDSNSIWIAYVGVALLVAAASFFNPAASALTPTIVTKEELFSANALSSSAWGIMVMVGSGLGGLVSALLGREMVFIFNAISFLASNWLIWSVKMPVRPVKTQAEIHADGSTWKQFIVGTTFLRQHPAAMVLVCVKCGWSMAAGVLVLLAVFGEQVFRAGDAGIGLLFAARGGGALIGPFLLRPFVGDDAGRMRQAIIASFVMSGLGYTLFGFSGAIGLWLAAIALILAHFGGGGNWVTSTILIQRVVPNYLLGRIMAIDYGLVTLTTAISTLIWSASLQNGVSPLLLAYVGGAVFIVYGLFWAILTAQANLKINNQTLVKDESVNAGH